MGIFKKNTDSLLERKNYELISGMEFLFKRASNSGIKNIFLDNSLIPLLPEISKPSFLKIYSNSELFWTSVYSLSMTHQRIISLTYDQSFFNFIFLEKYFTNNSNLNGGIVIFLFKKKGIKNFSFALKSIFPAYNYHKIDDFLDSLPYYFELSEKLKLPVLIYLDEGALYEFKPDEFKEYTERTEKKQLLQLNNDGDEKISPDLNLKQNFRYFRNIGKSFELFKGKNRNNLIFCDGKNFHRIIEDLELSENSDIILFNLLNPLETEGLTDIIKEGCNDYYKNIYIFDYYNILRFQLSELITGGKLNLKYENLKVAGSYNNPGFCIDDFTPSNIKIEPSFCVGCNLFTFLHKLKDRKTSADDILIGDDECFSLIKSSALKYSFPNLLIIKDPLYFASSLNPKDLNKSLYVFISSSKFSEQLGIFIKTMDNMSSKDKITFIVYKSIRDFNCNINDAVMNPLLKSFKKVILKEGIRLKDIDYKNDSTIIFLGNNCENNAKAGRNLNYLKYLYINNNICNKFECKLCYQLTKCPAIKVNEDKDIIIDGQVCTICNLCVDICPHNSIKLKKRKRIKIKKPLESKINLK
ncbi:MAG: hypothetical protein M0016_02040 [Deltaproteobacteria bacterium]|jgi:NAD-dependent dihydropyrimidine dehydrogenase PreA subunit|nr:hypothetical protein [Deltaproteobacteria bacterium]MCL5879790.1 hypothetical protein [Deltaproteobacteria bacterium]MDA8303927.1 hypothetical protein [Deltaproteobacteria bacterium]